MAEFQEKVNAVVEGDGCVGGGDVRSWRGQRVDFRFCGFFRSRASVVRVRSGGVLSVRHLHGRGCWTPSAICFSIEHTRSARFGVQR